MGTVNWEEFRIREAADFEITSLAYIKAFLHACGRSVSLEQTTVSSHVSTREIDPTTFSL